MKEKLKHTIKIVTFFLVIKNSNRTSFYAIPHQQHQTVKQKKKTKQNQKLNSASKPAWEKTPYRAM